MMSNPGLIKKPFCVENILQAKQNLLKNFVIPGLSKKKVGFLNGPPNIGKSFLLQTLAYEVALAKPLVGIIDSETANPLKVLFLCQEDGLDGFLSRAESQIQIFSQEELKVLQEQLVPAVMPYSLINRNPEDPKCKFQVEMLINDAKNYDLVIIDTARKVMGNAREVEEDKLLEDVLDQVANEADVAILVSHHLTKLHADRKQKLDINATGGSGLSSTQASSKYHLTLYYGDDKGHATTKLWHSKYNYVPKDKLISELNPIVFTQNELDLFIASNIDHSTNRETVETLRKLESTTAIETSDHVDKKEFISNGEVDLITSQDSHQSIPAESELIEAGTGESDLTDQQDEASQQTLTPHILLVDPEVKIVTQTSQKEANVTKRQQKIIDTVAKETPISPLVDSTSNSKAPSSGALFGDVDDDQY
ncbi:AAA family ATPase [Vibrio jasicida]